MTTEIRKSFFAFSFLIFILIAVKVFIIFNPEMLRSVAQVGVFEWYFLLLWTVLGSIGILLAIKSGFAQPWDKSISLALRFYYPILIGLSLGTLAVRVDSQTHWADWVAQQLKIATIHIPFPASLPIYLGGAIIVEIVYQIFPIALLYFLISKVIMKKDSPVVFWVLAVLTSLLEPAGSISLYKHSLVAAVLVVSHDAVNLSQAWFHKTAGFISALLVRVGYYLIWHILWGLWQQG